MGQVAIDALATSAFHMPKLIIRTIALILLPCLLTDGNLAAAISQKPNFLRQDDTSIPSHNFEIQAVVATSFASAILPRVRAHIIRYVSPTAMARIGTIGYFVYTLRIDSHLRWFFIISAGAILAANTLGNFIHWLGRRLIIGYPVPPFRMRQDTSVDTWLELWLQSILASTLCWGIFFFTDSCLILHSQ